MGMKIVVAGNGAAAWLSAAAVARSRGNDDCKVTVLDVHSSNPIQPFGLGDATLPLLQPGNDPFPDDFSAVALAGSTFSHGIAMSGWAAPGATYFQPFGQVGADLGPVSFRQLVLKLRKEGVAMRFGDYSLSAMAAQAGRFQLPGQDPRSVLSTCRHGLHADLARLGELAKTRAKALGVSEAGILG